MSSLKQPLRTLPGTVTRPRWLPPKVCIYGTPGVGKSTFGAGAPNPVFIPTEAGVENLDVARFPVAESLADFMAHLMLVATREHDHGAVVIDTLNGLMDLYYQDKKDMPGEKGRALYDFVGFGGFGGWSGVARDVKAGLIPLLNKCQERGMYVILLAHTGEYTRNNPLGDNLVVAAPAIPKWVWKELHGDLDVIGRADYVYSTTQVKSGEKAKASTDTEVVDGVKVKVRQLTFDGGVEQDCKTRVGYELPATLPLSWEAFAGRLGNVRALAGEIRELWRYLPGDKEAATIAWLGVTGTAQLAEAARSKLSQLRNRLLEAKAGQEATEEARAAEPGAEAGPDGTAADGRQPDGDEGPNTTTAEAQREEEDRQWLA